MQFTVHRNIVLCSSVAFKYDFFRHFIEILSNIPESHQELNKKKGKFQALVAKREFQSSKLR